jgi:hypothetical protein
MPRALKVFRTPAGFYDAVVAAPSQKAALAAWGTTTNLFASGDARVAEDPALQAEALAHPGEVIKRSRGDFAAMIGPEPPTLKGVPPDNGSAPMHKLSPIFLAGSFLFGTVALAFSPCPVSSRFSARLP